MTEFEKYARLDRGISSLSLHNYAKMVSGGSIQQPVVLEQGQLNMTAVDVFSRLMVDRTIFLGQTIDENVANIVTAQLLFLNSQDNKPISMYLNTPGGSVVDGLQIYDTMQLIKSPVHTIATGLAASMGSIILVGGEDGCRGALPNATIMIHQVMGGGYGQMADVEIASKEMKRIQNLLYGILAERTGKSIKQITKDADRDKWMSPQDALQYGIIDKVFTGKGLL
jgi:ATP-dependent Clp protease protease subunit